MNTITFPANINQIFSYDSNAYGANYLLQFFYSPELEQIYHKSNVNVYTRD